VYLPLPQSVAKWALSILSVLNAANVECASKGFSYHIRSNAVLYTPFEVDTINVVSEAVATKVVSTATLNAITFHIAET
jgi:hypothetical protein